MNEIKRMSEGDLCCKCNVSLQRRFISNGALTLLVCGWLICVGSGMAVLAKYEFTPGQSVSAQSQWPEDSQIDSAATSRTLLLFVHPHCPCSQATMEQFDRIMARSGSQLTAQIIFCIPPEFDEAWAQSSLWRKANHSAALPNVFVKMDHDAVETKRFGAQTSGQILLYDPGGQLRFAGGITPSRGHCGDNLGQQRIASIVSDADAPLFTECSTFGCPLFNEDHQLRGTVDGN